MGEIFLSIMVSLDGYAADRNGGLDWCLVPDGDVDELMADQLRSIHAMVFGHNAYRELAPYWQDGPTETAVDREQTELMNSVTKLVLSRGQPELPWGPAERIGADLPDEMAKLKGTSRRDIAVFAGPEAANALLPYVDEVRLLVYPVLLGAGLPPFRGQPCRLELVGSGPGRSRCRVPCSCVTDPLANRAPGTLTAMPDELIDERAAETGHTDNSERIFSGFGIASTVLGVIAVAAVALAVLIWAEHRSDVDERRYQTRVLQAAADWTGVVINMNKDSVDASMQKLHEGTVGQLNADFHSVVEPYRRLVQTLQSKTTGQIDSVAIETIHHTSAPTPKPQPELSAFAARTDTVMVVATSVSENVGAEPKTVRWNLRLDVSDVDGKLLISRLEPIR